MIKNILFIIEGTNKKKSKVLESRLKEISKEVKVEIFFDINKTQDYSILFPVYSDCKYVCLLNEDMKIENNFLELFAEYNIEEDHTIYLPLVILENESTKGVLNNCMWNPNLAVEVGCLDHDLALKQMDTTLYGALIPTMDFLSKEYYNKDVQFYQHFYFLNKYTSSEENLVVGIPKVLFSTSIDLSFEGIETDIKVKNFKLAKQEFNNQNKLHAV